jgi:hypothetical protein
VNGFNLGVVQTAPKIPAFGMRWEPSKPSEPAEGQLLPVAVKERSLYDGLVPIIHFVPGVFSDFQWFRKKSTDVVNVGGLNCTSLKEAMDYEGLSDAAKLPDNQKIVFWLHHLFIHDPVHVGCSDPVAEGNCSQENVHEVGCGGCDRARTVVQKKGTYGVNKKKMKIDSSSSGSSSGSSSSGSRTITSSPSSMSSSSGSGLEQWLSRLSPQHREFVRQEGEKMYKDLVDRK